MSKTIMGVFPTEEQANAALSTLNAQGVKNGEISVVKKQVSATTSKPVESKGEQVSEGAVSGATTGGIIGGVAGLLVGVGALAIPGFGALLIGGPLIGLLGITGAAATAASGAVTGAVAGGLLGGLVSLGVPRERAEVIEKRIENGDILLGVETEDGRESEVSEVLTENGAEEVTIVNK